MKETLFPGGFWLLLPPNDSGRRHVVCNSLVDAVTHAQDNDILYLITLTLGIGRSGTKRFEIINGKAV